MPCLARCLSSALTLVTSLTVASALAQPDNGVTHIPDTYSPANTRFKPETQAFLDSFVNLWWEGYSIANSSRLTASTDLLNLFQIVARTDHQNSSRIQQAINYMQLAWAHPNDSTVIYISNRVEKGEASVTLAGGWYRLSNGTIDLYRAQDILKSNITTKEEMRRQLNGPMNQLSYKNQTGPWNQIYMYSPRDGNSALATNRNIKREWWFELKRNVNSTVSYLVNASGDKFRVRHE